MKKTKTNLCILAVFIIFILMAAASSSEGTKKEIAGSEDNSQNNADVDETNDSSTSDSSDTSDDKKSTSLETIYETVLLDQDGIRITAKEIVNDSIWGKGIKVLIENESDKNVGVQCNTLVVNNYMISDLFSGTVAAGKKDNETITLLSTGLEEAGIDTISEINVSFHIFDADSYDTMFDTDEITIKTSAYGKVDQPVMDSGTELLNKDGVRIVGKYVTEDSFWGAGVLLFIENTSDKDVLVQSDNMSINGYMVTPYFSCQVNKGRMALDTITILSSDLEENNISEVKDLELNFSIINPKNYDTIFESNLSRLKLLNKLKN
jgi:hypothetical protein